MTEQNRYDGQKTDTTDMTETNTDTKQIRPRYEYRYEDTIKETDSSNYKNQMRQITNSRYKERGRNQTLNSIKQFRERKIKYT